MGDPIAGKVVLVTGASSGIGWETALAFGRLGAKVAVAARREDRLRELAKLLPGECLVAPWDAGRAETAKGLVDKVLARWGRLDILVNNAGVMATAHFHEQPFAEVEAVMRTNYLGAAALLQESLGPMLRQKDGHIVNVASIAGVMGFPYMASYAASKHALVGLTEALRREYRGTGVTLTALCPGTVHTPMSAESLKDARVARFTFPKTAEQVAAVIVRACRDRSPEVIYGDVPGFLLKLAAFIPGLTDLLLHRVYKSIHPFARSSEARRELV